MTSKREIEREVQSLHGDETKGEAVVLNLTSLYGSPGETLTREDSPHPELTVESHPDSDRHNDLSIAIPNVWNNYPEAGVLIVHSCKSVTETWGEEYENDPNTRLACELWDSLSEADLRREYEHRADRGEPIPPLLEEYAAE